MLGTTGSRSARRKRSRGTWPCRDSEVMTPGGAETENASLPAVTLTVGSPNRFASAGARMKGPFRPVCTSVIEPSACIGGLPRPVPRAL